MTGNLKKLTYTIAATLIAVMCFLILSNGGASAKADVAASPRSKTVAAYESQNVWDDLQGATIDGEGIDLNLYNFDEHKNVQIISFVEFCYSFYAENQGDYGLYVYVYNPHGCDFTKNTLLNKIEFRVDAGLSIKPNLQFLNRSNKTGYEGLFYKFKVALTDAQRTKVLDAVNSSARVYEVSGIELYSEGTNATEYKIVSKYTYTGYAKGYGEVGAVNDTLNCTVDGFDEFLTLDVHPTYYRPKGTHSDGYTRDTLHSVYFSVPNETIDEYGEMTAVHAQWLNALTAPMLVTGNKDIYNAIYPYLNVEIDGGTCWEYASAKFPYALVATKAAKEAMGTEDAAVAGYYAYNAYSDWDEGEPGVKNEYDNVITNLRYLFYAENGDADNYDLPREKVVGDKAKGVKGWLETYTERFGSKTVPLVNGKYARELFEKVDKEFTDKNIEATEEYHLTDKIVSNSIWDKIFGTQLKGDRPDIDISAIQPVTQKDVEFYPDKDIFCEKFYIAQRDYENFCTFINDAAKKEKPETVYLFRYYQSEYESHKATEYSRTTAWSMLGTYGTYKTIDTNAFISKSWVQLDFDIIDLTFSKDNVKTVIPCIMSPLDIMADAEHPVDPHPDGNGTPWWVWLIVGIGVFLLLCFIPGFLPLVGKILFWTIALPFRILWAVICAPFRIIKQRREKRRKALEKDRAREEKRMQKEQRKRKPAAPSEPEAQTSSKATAEKNAVKKPAKKKITEQLADKFKRKPKPQAKSKPTKKPAAEPAPQIKEAAATSDEQSAPKKLKKPQAKQLKQKNKTAPKSGKKG